MTSPIPGSGSPVAKPRNQRDRNARKVELTAQTAAGTVGSAFGAAKLRDAYKVDSKKNPARLARGASHVKHGAVRAGVSPRTAVKVARAIEHGTPGFKPLAAAVTAGAVATGAHRYQQIDAYLHRKKAGIAKSQLPDGRYKPADQLSPGQRSAVGRAATNRSVVARRVRSAPAPRRGLSELYQHHGFGMSSMGTAALVHGGPTVQSKVHPKIHYGPTIGPEHHAALDRKIDPAQAAKLRHTVVMHHAELPGGILAAALGSHVTTGHRGHVVLNSEEMSGKGKVQPWHPVKGHQVIAHELAHASLKHSNPVKFMTGHDHKAVARSMGEEGRADAVSQKGKGLYQRTGAVAPKKFVGVARRATTLGRSRAEYPGEHPSNHIQGVRADRAAIGGQIRYHQVRGAVRAAAKIKKSVPHRAPSAPIRLRVTPDPRHAARPYVGARRVASPIDRAKAKLTMHAPRIYDVLEGVTDLAKSQGRVAPSATLASGIERGLPMTTSAFGVEHGSEIAKANHRRGESTSATAANRPGANGQRLMTVGNQRAAGPGRSAFTRGQSVGRAVRPTKGKVAVAIGAATAATGAKATHDGIVASRQHQFGKALTGTPGDKRNTKYAAAGIAGANVGALLTHGSGLGSTVGAGSAAGLYHNHRNSLSGAKGIQDSRRAAHKRKTVDIPKAKAIRSADVSVAKSAFGAGREAGNFARTWGKENGKVLARTTAHGSTTRKVGYAVGRNQTALRVAGGTTVGGAAAGGGAVAVKRKKEMAKSAFGVDLIGKADEVLRLLPPKGYQAPKPGLRTKVPTSDPLNLGRTLAPAGSRAAANGKLVGSALRSKSAAGIAVGGALAGAGILADGAHKKRQTASA